MNRLILKLSAILFLLFSNNSNGQWVQTNGLPTTTVNALIATDNTIFAGAESGGVYLTTNYGTSWTQVNEGLINTHITSFALPLSL